MGHKIELNGCVLELSQGDITKEETNAIANAANTRLAGGGGVDGAIHRAGGPAIMEECRKIGRCPTGDAVITTGGNLKAPYVIHTAGPVWHGGKSGEAEKLASCYRRILEVAVENNCESVAIPSISTGIYGYPVGEAASIAIKEIKSFLEDRGAPKLVRMVLFDAQTFEAYAKHLGM